MGLNGLKYAILKQSLLITFIQTCSDVTKYSYKFCSLNLKNSVDA